MEVLVSSHSDSTVSEYDSLSGQLIRVTDPQSHIGILGHRLTSSESLTDSFGSSSLVMNNKSSAKVALWAAGEMGKTRQQAMATESQHLNATLHATVSHLSSAITCMAVSPCRRWIARGTADGEVLVTHLAVSSAATPSAAAAGPSTASSFTKQQQQSSQRRWKSSSSSQGHSVRMTSLHIGAVTSISISSSGWIATGGQDCSIHVFSLYYQQDSSYVKQHIQFQEHSLPVVGLLLLDSGRLFSISKDQTCKIYDVFSESLLASISFPSALTCLSVHALQDSIFVGAANGNVYRADLWKLAHHQITSSSSSSTNTSSKRQPLAIFASVLDQTSISPVSALALSLDGTKLAVGYASGLIAVWDSSSCQKLYFIQHNKTTVTHILFHTQGKSDDPFVLFTQPLSKDTAVLSRILSQIPSHFHSHLSIY